MAWQYDNAKIVDMAASPFKQDNSWKRRQHLIGGWVYCVVVPVPALAGAICFAIGMNWFFPVLPAAVAATLSAIVGVRHFRKAAELK